MAPIPCRNFHGVLCKIGGMEINMIMFWNRRELYIGSDMEAFSRVRSILSAKNIKYQYKVVNSLGSSNRGHSGAFGINTANSFLYYVYVHRKDYELVSEYLQRQ